MFLNSGLPYGFSWRDRCSRCIFVSCIRVFLEWGGDRNTTKFWPVCSLRLGEVTWLTKHTWPGWPETWDWGHGQGVFQCAILRHRAWMKACCRDRSEITVGKNLEHLGNHQNSFPAGLEPKFFEFTQMSLVLEAGRPELKCLLSYDLGQLSFSEPQLSHL